MKHTKGAGNKLNNVLRADQQWQLNKWIERLGEEYINNKEMDLVLLADTASKELRYKVTSNNLKTAIDCVFDSDYLLENPDDDDEFDYSEEVLADTSKDFQDYDLACLSYRISAAEGFLMGIRSSIANVEKRLSKLEKQ